MDIRNLKPAGDFAINYGFKAIVYGPAGSGKTPVFNTAPRPVLLACEPGLLSMRGSKIPTCRAETSQQIDEFFTWLFASNEVKAFDTVGIDSASHMCSLYLKTAEKANKHGLAAYGEMADEVLKHLEKLSTMQYKHAYIVAKQEVLPIKGLNYCRPYYPGKQLPIEMPHKFDGILQLDIHNIPGVGARQAFRCIGSIDAMARNRIGTLNEFEPPNFADLVNKAMVQ